MRKSLTEPGQGRCMDRELNQADSKKPYAPPQLVTINLRPEEAVLGHCKISGGGGGPQPPTCAALFCMSLGS
jgi:hypothetical protein